MGAKAPYGYMKDENNKNKLIVNKEEAKIVKRIFQMYDSGSTMGQIAKKLQDEKVYCPSYNGFEKNKNGIYGWNYSSLSKILKNEFYLGNTVYGKVINLSYKSKKVKFVPREEWKVVANTHKAIISKELFDSVQKKIKLSQKAKTHKHTHEPIISIEDFEEVQRRRASRTKIEVNRNNQIDIFLKV